LPAQQNCIKMQASCKGKPGKNSGCGCMGYPYTLLTEKFSLPLNFFHQATVSISFSPAVVRPLTAEKKSF